MLSVPYGTVHLPDISSTSTSLNPKFICAFRYRSTSTCILLHACNAFFHTYCVFFFLFKQKNKIIFCSCCIIIAQNMNSKIIKKFPQKY